MKRYFLIIFIFTACLFLLPGCGKREQSYFPLQEGMQWSYKVTKTIRGSTKNQKYIFVSLPNDKFNDEYASIRKSMDGTLLYYRETEKGPMFVGQQTQSGLFERNERYIFRYPLQKGIQWQETTTTKLLHRVVPPIYKRIEFTTEIPLSVTIETTDDTVNVPAGIYVDCIKIVKHGSKNVDLKNYKGFLVGTTIIDIDEVSWYAPGVGLVRFTRKETTDSHTLNQGEIIVELESFDT